MNEITPSAVKRSWLYELPLFYLCLLVVQRAVFKDDPGFHASNPSPLWLGLLLFGLRYGIGAGLAAGGFSAALFVIGVRQAGEGYRLSDPDFYLLPGLFLSVGAALGAVRDTFNHRVAGLESRIEGLQERAQGLQNQVETQQKALRAIEQQVVSQMSSVVTLYHGSQELGTLDRAALPRAALDFFTRALQASKTSLYRVHGDALELEERRGWEAGDGFAKSMPLGRGVIGLAASERRVVSARETQAEPGDAIMAAPLLEPNGDVAAVFAVQLMPFLRFNSASVNLLTLLAEWGSESLAKCAQVDALKSRSLLDEEFEIHSARYFANRLAQEFARSRKDGSPLAVLLLAADDSLLPPERRPAVTGALSRLLRDAVEDTGVVSRSPWAEARFAVLLPGVTKAKADDLRESVEKTLAGLDLPARVRAGVAAFKKDMKTPEEIIAQARAELG
jgi:polysaccharide biosynthesis protein PelD